MPRSRDHAAFEATSEQIKTLARQQMAEQGTGAISLRAIARSLEVTAPALYRYFPSLDDLITALILDAFHALADAVDAADAACDPADFPARLRAVMSAYRQWALDHPTDFQLIYGNPIPGYVAPSERTVPAATRPLVRITRILAEADAAGCLRLPDHPMTPQMEAHVRALLAERGDGIDPRLIHMMAVGWTQAHGTVMLELFEHLGPAIGDVDGFFRGQIERLIADYAVRAARPIGNP